VKLFGSFLDGPTCEVTAWTLACRGRRSDRERAAGARQRHRHERPSRKTRGLDVPDRAGCPRRWLLCVECAIDVASRQRVMPGCRACGAAALQCEWRVRPDPGPR
jgi:hypothetical protein